MAAPNIDMLVASLRSCSLGDDAAPASPPAEGNPANDGGAGDAAAAGAGDTTLELNSELALPYPWQQCLDLKVHPLLSSLVFPYYRSEKLYTGKLYYINWHTGAKSMEDPRKLAGIPGGCDSKDDGDDADDEREGGEGGGGDEDKSSSEGEAEAATGERGDDGCGNCCCCSSSSALSSSSTSSSASSRVDAMEGGTVLVAAGCRACMMYVMIAKGAEECPRCGGRVICFGRS